jgi:peptidoglycan/xylan/chitin deacetylase (PgdA/CDA1 family)
MKWLLVSLVSGFFLALGLIFIGNALQEPYAVVSITFDDGYVSQYDAAAELEKYGFYATYYIPSGLVGKEFEGIPIMPSADVLDLYKRGHEIGAHTADHVLARNSSESFYEIQLVMGKDISGIVAKNFAFPYNDHSKEELALKYFDTARNSEGGINNITERSLRGLALTHDNYVILEDYLAKLEGNGGWLVIVIHDISENPREDIDMTPEEFAWVLQTLRDSKVPVMTIRQVRDGKA